MIPKSILPPDPNPLKPSYVPPPDACDAHCHIFGPGDKFPYAPNRTAAEEIRKKYKVDATVHTVDLGVTESAVALGQKCGHVDVLVNNAGAIPHGGLTPLLRPH